MANGWQNPRYQPHGHAPKIASTSEGGKQAPRLGYRFEASVRGQLQRRGWYVMRAAQSKGIIDLLAIHKDMPALMIQCKRTGLISSAEWNLVYELAGPYGAIPVLCYRSSPKITAYMRMDGPREFKKPGRPWTEIDPRTCEPVAIQLGLVA